MARGRAPRRRVDNSTAPTAAAVERVLAGLDKDLLDYVTGLCEEEEIDDDELAKKVEPFCSELCDEEDAAASKVQEGDGREARGGVWLASRDATGAGWMGCDS